MHQVIYSTRHHDIPCHFTGYHEKKNLIGHVAETFHEGHHDSSYDTALLRNLMCAVFREVSRYATSSKDASWRSLEPILPHSITAHATPWYKNWRLNCLLLFVRYRMLCSMKHDGTSRTIAYGTSRRPQDGPNKGKN